jgi:hypothetical protein
LPALLWLGFRWRPTVVWTVAPATLSAPLAWLTARLCGAKAWLHVQDLEFDAAFRLGLLRGTVLRQGLTSHNQGGGSDGAPAVAMGLSGLLAQPEFSLTTQLRPLVQLVEHAPQQVLQGGGIWIGAEHPIAALHHCSLVQADYHCGDGSVGQVALVGPMRMAYATARAAVCSVARVLERLLG